MIHKVNVIGLGYIGLPTALMLASNSVTVVGTDYNEKLIETLKSGKMTFDEVGLDLLLKKARNAGISFTVEYQKADVYIISVPTPYDKESKKINTCFILSAIEQVINVCEKGAIIVVESTISPGTIDRYVRPVIRKKGFKDGEDIHLVHAPERIIPGNMIHELQYNNRTIGADSREIGEKIKAYYATFCKGEIIITDIKTAEMSKVVENTYRDINIAFANELAKICRQDSMDVYEIIKIANMHPRVNILQPGPGVGGHCISVDPWFLVGDYPGLANLILTARKTNDSMPEFVLERIREIMEQHGVSDISKVGLYGLTYKENVDDVRESPTLQMLELMRKHLAQGIKVFDPMVDKDLVQNQYHDFNRFLNDIELLVIMVGHQHLQEHINEIGGKIILDTRNVCKDKSVYHL